MDELLKQILAELKALNVGQDALQTKLQALKVGQEVLQKELKEFRESQEATNKLLTSDTVGVKNQLRDIRDDMKEFRREIRDWTRATDRKIDTLEDRLDGVRDALN